jgi:LysR family nod box-dependent transcriptional activator
LRELLNDELLVARGRKMVLTRVSQELLPGLEALLIQIADLVETDNFDPHTSQRTFNLCMVDYLATTILPPLRRSVSMVAPSIALRIDSAVRGTIDHLRTGELDAVVFPARSENWSTFGAQPGICELDTTLLFQDRMVGIEWGSMPQRSGPMDVDEYLSRPHIEYFRNDGRQTMEQKTLADAGYAQRSQCYVPSFWLVSQMIGSSDLIGLVPESFATTCADWFDVRSFELPLAVPPFDVVMVTMRSRKQHADVEWLRDRIKDASSTWASQRESRGLA